MRPTIHARSSLLSFKRPSYSLGICWTFPQRRHRSTEATSTPEPVQPSLNPRWLSDVRLRVGTCLMHGVQPEQVKEAGEILQEVARDWRELLLGSEGYLTGPTRRGLYRQRVVWGEEDSMGHVNNVQYNRYAESGRIEWAQKYGKFIDPANAKDWYGLMRPTKTGLILRKITTDFKFPMKYPDRISVYHKLGNEPTETMEAFHFDAVIVSELHQRPAARVVEDCVLYDYSKGKKTTLPPLMLAVLQETWRLQEEARRTNSERVHGLLDRVRKLELESWDRGGSR